MIVVLSFPLKPHWRRRYLPQRLRTDYSPALRPAQFVIEAYNRSAQPPAFCVNHRSPREKRQA